MVAHSSELTSPAELQVFYVPILRHMFYWLGACPADKAEMRRILSRNGACMLIPGGVAECTEMEHGSEVVFLRKRQGFIKLALEQGAATLAVGCAFCFQHGPVGRAATDCSCPALQGLDHNAAALAFMVSAAALADQLLAAALMRLHPNVILNPDLDLLSELLPFTLLLQGHTWTQSMHIIPTHCLPQAAY